MYVILETGESLSGTPAHIVQRMRETARVQASDDATYMHDVAFRCAQWDGSVIATSDAETFLHSLAACDFLLLEGN